MGIAYARWALELTGDAFDLADWAALLKEPFDPWGSVIEETLVLRWSGFTDADTAEQVYAKALPLVDQLNGAMRIASETRPLAVSGVVEFGADGVRKGVIRYAVGLAEGRARATSDAVVVRPDGTIVPPPRPHRSEVQEWIALSDTHEPLADALIYLSRAEWFDVYKAIECLEATVGGEAVLSKMGWIGSGELKRLKQTANSFRHRSGGTHRPPNPPTTLKEAEHLLAAMVREAFKWVQRAPV